MREREHVIKVRIGALIGTHPCLLYSQCGGEAYARSFMNPPLIPVTTNFTLHTNHSFEYPTCSLHVSQWRQGTLYGFRNSIKAINFQ